MGKFHALRDERVRADDDLPFARGDRFMRAALLRGRHLARKQTAGDAQRREYLLRAFQMLRGEDFRRRHQRALKSGPRAQIQRAQRDVRLAAAHVALHHARHGLFVRHVLRDFRKYATLRARGRKRQRPPEIVRRLRLRGNHRAIFSLAAQPGHRRLVIEQFFKRKAVFRARERLQIIRKMRLRKRRMPVEQIVFAHDFRWQIVLDHARAQNRLHRIAQELSRHARHSLIHRRDPTLMHDGGIDDEKAALLARHAAKKRHALSAGELLLHPGLVKKHHAHAPRAVRHGRGYPLHAARAVQRRPGDDIALKRRFPVLFQILNRRDRRRILIAHGQHAQQLLVRFDAAFAQRARSFGAKARHIRQITHRIPLCTLHSHKQKRPEGYSPKP